MVATYNFGSVYTMQKNSNVSCFASLLAHLSSLLTFNRNDENRILRGLFKYECK